jgi:hypothetical protein
MKTKYSKKLRSLKLSKIFCILILLGAFCTYANAQTVAYSYDNNGNRTTQSLWVSHSMVHHHGSDSAKNDSILVVKYGINVYPNPTSAQVNISISSFQPCGSALVYLLDASGNALSSQTATSSPVPLNLANYNQGIYYVKIVVCGDQLSYKVIKTSPGAGNPTKTKPPLVK